MSRNETRWAWIITLLVGLYFLVANATEADWIMVGLAAFVVAFAAYRLLNRRTPPGAAR